MKSLVLQKIYFARRMSSIGNNKIITLRYDSPCGQIMLGAHDGRICLCDWISGKHRPRTCEKLKRFLHAEFEEEESAVIELAKAALNRYFSGDRISFELPLLFVGTDFQEEVWKALLDIPYGATMSYGELARKIGRPKAVRAVANANGANPISIFVPCHRVIGSDGSLTGYGGGLDVKEYLLRLEKGL